MLDDTIVEPNVDHWALAKEVLLDLLAQHNGCVGTSTLRKRMESKGISNAREMIARLKYSQSEGEDLGFRHHGRSFFSAEAFRRLEQDTESAATQSECAEVHVDTSEDVEAPRRENRQEEARLVRYLFDALNDLYATEYGPTDAEYVFDVHNERPGSEFENVDLLAAHWRSDELVELVAVEVKLAFTARLVQQANNYRRFADRVWIATVVDAALLDAAGALRELDPLLFEHAVDQGIGILACRRTIGRSYEVTPVHWPRRLQPDAMERAEFLERYRIVFEEASVLAPKDRRFPRVR